MLGAVLARGWLNTLDALLVLGDLRQDGVLLLLDLDDQLIDGIHDGLCFSVFSLESSVLKLGVLLLELCD